MVEDAGANGTLRRRSDLASEPLTEPLKRGKHTPAISLNAGALWSKTAADSTILISGLRVSNQ
jgi:hypothetical protein